MNEVSSSNLVLVAEAESVLRLVHDALAAAAVDVLILGAAELVADFLAGGLLVVGLDATRGGLVIWFKKSRSEGSIPSNLITDAGNGLLQLLLGRFG